MARLNQRRSVTNTSFSVNIQVTSPFDFDDTNIPERLTAGRHKLEDLYGSEQGRKLWGRFNKRFYGITSLRILDAVRPARDSVRARAQTNARGQGTSKGKLRVHKPLAGARLFKTSVATVDNISTALKKGFRGTGATGRLELDLFTIDFAPRNRLLGFIGKMMDQGADNKFQTGKQGGVRDITSDGFGQGWSPTTIRPTKSRWLLIPSYNADSYSNAPESMLADTIAYGSSDPNIRYLRFSGGSNRRRRLTDLPPVNGWRFVIRGFHKPKRGKRLPRGIYLVPGRKRSSSDNRMVMTHEFKKVVRVKPKGWFSYAMADWYHGRGGATNTYRTFEKRVELELEKSVETAWKHTMHNYNREVKADAREVARAARRARG